MYMYFIKDYQSQVSMIHPRIHLINYRVTESNIRHFTPTINGRNPQQPFYFSLLYLSLIDHITERYSSKITCTL